MPELRRLVPDAFSLARLKEKQAHYFATLFTGPRDWDYVLQRLRIGIVHERVGLAPEWYLGAYAFYLERLIPAIFAEMPDVSIALRAARALIKVVFFDLTLALDAYFHAHARALEHAAAHDPLTELPNRYRLLKELEARAARKEPFALVLARVGELARVNRLLGTKMGDRLLRDVAAFLRREARRGYLARASGDVFAILLPDADMQQALQKAQKLAGLFQSEQVLRGMRVHTPLALGLAVFDPEEGKDAGDVLERAETALRRAAREPARVRAYDAKLAAAMQRRARLAEELAHAIENDELELWFQPQVRLVDGRVVGAEALLRWHHPARGLVPPSEFVPVAEEEGLIPALTHWVLRAACAQCAHWHAHGFAGDFRVAVNVSGVDVQDAHFPERVAGLLAAHDLPPQMLVLEVTETALIANAEAAKAVLAELRARGLRLAIDDFGTGHASLRYLHELPVQELKVDRSFVGTMTKDAKSRAIVRAIIALAHELGLEVVAEGAEDEATLRMLAELACDRVQGYALARPMPAARFEAWVQGCGFRCPLPSL